MTKTTKQYQDLEKKQNEIMEELFKEDCYEEELHDYDLPPTEYDPVIPDLNTAEEYFQYYRDCTTKNKPKSARMALRKSLSMDTENQLYIREFAIAEYEYGKTFRSISGTDIPEKIISCLNYIITKNEKDSEALFYRAKTYKFTGKTDEAIKDIKSAIKLEPKNINYYEFLSEIYINKEEYNKAIETYDNIIKFETNNPKYYIKRGEVYFKSDNDEQALKDANKALFFDSFNPDAFHLKYQIYDKYNKNWKALSYIERSIQHTQNIFEREIWLAQKIDLLKKMERYEDVIENIDIILSYDCILQDRIYYLKQKIEILLKIHKYLPIIPAYISLLKTKYEEYEFEKTPIY